MNNVKEEKYKVVDWRFWRWRRAAAFWSESWRQAQDELLVTAQARADLQKRVEELKGLASEAMQRLKAAQSALGMQTGLATNAVGLEFAKEAEIRAAFEGVYEGTKWWVMLNRVLERRTREELGLAVLPGVDAEERHYRAGAAAALMELVVGMHRLKEQAQREPGQGTGPTG